MTYPHIKHVAVIIGIIGFSVSGFSQDCKVSKKELIGEYKGECRKGKAHGKGKATGTDTYEGEFKSGLPEGKGVYTFSNGNIYRGDFKDGKMEGHGSLTYKREGASDSVVTGYWKKDRYYGKYENPYRIVFRSKLVTEVEVEYKTDPYNRITFFITNTSGGATTFEGNELPKLKVDEVRAVTGAYGRLYVNDSHAKKTESIIEDVRFPIRMKAIMGTEEIEMEFFEAGTYVINLRIND